MRFEAGRVAAVLLALAVLLAPGCGRSYVTEQELERLSTEYVRLLTDRKLDEAARFLTGEARQAAAVTFPLLQMVEARQRLLEVAADAERVTEKKDRGQVRVTYRVQTEVPGFGTTTERVRVLLEWFRKDVQSEQGEDPAGGWRIYRISILEQEEEK